MQAWDVIALAGKCPAIEMLREGRKMTENHKHSTGTGVDPSDSNVCDGLWKRPIRGPMSPLHSVTAPSRVGQTTKIGLEMEFFAYDAKNLTPLGLSGSVFHPSELLK